MSLTRLEIRTQMALVAGLVLIGFLTIGGIFWISVSRSEEVRTDLRTAAEILRHAQDSAYWVSQAAIAQKAFLNRRTEEQVTAHEEAVAQAEAALDALMGGPEADHALVLMGFMREYEAAADRLVSAWRILGFDETQGLQGALRSSVHDIEARLDEITGVNTDALMVQMLMLRRHEKDFILRVDQKYVDRHAASLADFHDAVRSSSLPPMTKADLDTLAETYGEQFAAYATQRLGISTAVDELDALVDEIEPVLETLSENARALTERAQVAERDNISQTSFLIAVSIVVVTVLVVALVGVIAVGLNRALDRMGGAMERLSSGDLDVDVPARGWSNVIGRMAAAMDVFRTNLRRVRELEAWQKESERRAGEERQATMARLATQFESDVGGLVAGFRQAADATGSDAGEVMSDAEATVTEVRAVSTAVDRAAGNVETVASAAEELFSSIGEINRQITDSMHLARRAADEATGAVDGIAALDTAAEEISAVVTLITDISDKTNLLALNATIEAARAGDAGKGFAVVANEVKTLALQTGKATGEIGQQTQSIQKAVAGSRTTIREVAKLVNDIATYSSSVAAAVEQQSAATNEIARNVQEAASSTRQIETAVNALEQKATRTRGAADRMRGAAGTLTTRAADLNEKVQAFLRTVRSA